MAKNRGRRRGNDSGGGGASGSDAEVLSNDVMNGNYDYNREFYDRLFDNINELSTETLQELVNNFDDTYTLVKHYVRDGDGWKEDPDNDYYLDKSWLGNPFEEGSDVGMNEVATIPRTMDGLPASARGFDTLQNIRQLSETALKERYSNGDRDAAVTLQANNITEEYHVNANTNHYLVRENGDLMYMMESKDEGVPYIITDYR